MDNIIKCKKCDSSAIFEHTLTKYDNREVVSKTNRFHCSKCRISWSDEEEMSKTEEANS